MSAEQWNTNNQLLNYLQQEIQSKTYGRLTRLDLDYQGSDVVIHANAVSYYDLQLADHTSET